MTLATFSATVDELMQIVAVHSTRSYSWIGDLMSVTQQRGLTEIQSLQQCLQARLYADFYIQGGPVPASDRADPRPDVGGAERLSISQGPIAQSPVRCIYVGCTQTGHAVDWDGVVFHADADTLDLPTGVRPGDAIVARVPGENLGIPGGFYTRYGNFGAARRRQTTHRYYWNIEPAGRSLLVSRIATALNAREVPFRVKVANDERTLRCDACVLYVAASDHDVRAIVCSIAEQLSSHLGSRTPVGTLRLRPGLAFSEDPDDGSSFGSRLCALLADGIIRVDLATTQPSRRSRDLIAWLARKGVDPQSPHRVRSTSHAPPREFGSRRGH